MKLYRVSYGNDSGNSAGFSFHSSQREAEQRKRAYLADAVDQDTGERYDLTAEIDTVEVQPTKAGILAALNLYADHADNG